MLSVVLSSRNHFIRNAATQDHGVIPCPVLNGAP